MSTRELHQRASALFLELRDMPAPERAARLRDIQSTSPELHLEVASLLRHDVGMETQEAAASHPASPQLPPGTPARIGPYIILERIGHGGSGIVLLAEQHEPVRRRVAIKIVPYAAVNPEFAARFEFERRALERTDHPNIARILDAGRTPDGLPYMVMDYVQGVPITQYCRDHKLGLKDRVLLVLDVADAVQHAHQRGVIHRDLKPANIFVTNTSGKATPRVLDFGIAKPTPGASGDESPPTSGLPLGTPAYMAPEQTGGHTIDTRADVYAIGAVMYELMCGRPPIDTNGDLMEVMRRIRETVPPMASTIRSPEPEGDAVPRAFLQDLDCILAKALEKKPDRRYTTVAALSEDLRRVLNREPIEAHPPSTMYRLARFTQRNRVLVGAVAIVALALVVGITGTTMGLVEARRQRKEAAYQLEAQRDINKFMTDDLLAAGSPSQLGEKATALDLLDRASTHVDDRFHGRPLIAATVHHTLGVVYTDLGSFDKAEQHLQRAFELRRDGLGPDAPEVVRTEVAIAGLVASRQKYAEAVKMLIPLIDRSRLILGPDDPGLFTALNDLGVVFTNMDRAKEAIPLLQEALAGRTRTLGPRDRQVLEVTSNLALAYGALGQNEQSLKMMLESLRIAESLDHSPQMTLIGLNNNIGELYLDMNRGKEAVPYIRKAADMAATLLGPENPDVWTIQGNLAAIESKTGNPLKAAELYDGIANAIARKMGEDAPDTFVPRFNRLSALWRAKKFDDAAAGLRDILPKMSDVLGDAGSLTVQARGLLARTLRDSGHLEEALPLAEQAAAQLTELYGAGHERTKPATALLAEIKSKLPDPPPTPSQQPTPPPPTPDG